MTFDKITNEEITALAEDTDATLTCAKYAITAAEHLLAVIAENIPKDAVLAQAEFMLTEHNVDMVCSQVCGINISPVTMLTLKLSGCLERSKANA